ncbi:MAG: 3-oxoacid CoA-transferase subunit B [Dehalococcoidia bacterium]|nr:3-oxoacid CoA-transferase subunit B [Dehalococcoidia bacterium]
MTAVTDRRDAALVRVGLDERHTQVVPEDGMRNKVFDSFDQAVADIPDGATIAVDSWGVAATAQNLIAALKRKGARDLTLVTHNFVPLLVVPEEEATMPTALLPQLKRLITAVVGVRQLGAGAFVKEWVEKGLQVELSSHGTLAARLHAGASALGGIYNPVGLGTVLQEGKEIRTLDGREYILEKPIKPDFAFIRGHKADILGNLVYRGTYRVDQPVMAMAAAVTIAEVDEIVGVGGLDAEHIVTPGIFVDRIIRIPRNGLGTPERTRALINKLGEFEIARKMLFRSAQPEPLAERPEVEMVNGRVRQRLDRDTIAMRAARELKPGDYANLGIGIPNFCALYIPDGVIFQSENGALGYGPLVLENEIDKAEFNYVDAGGRFVTRVPGMAIFDVVTSFSMIRGGRLVTVLGAMEVSEKGDLANWNTSQDALGGTIGGGMDLATGAKRVIVTMEHTTKTGKPKIVRRCSYPLTAKECVDLIVTDLAVIEVTPQGLVLKETAPGWTVEDIQAVTEARLRPAPDLKEIEL